MKKYQFFAFIGVLLVVVGVALVAQTTVFAQEQPPADPTAGPFLQAYHEAWLGSGHADFEAEAFRHWDEDGAVEEGCAKCHSAGGYLDFLGEDGSEFGVVNAPAPLGTVVNCDVCHNNTAANLTSVTFPSGVQISTSDNATRCMECHQGRASGATVATRIADAGVADMDTPSPDLGFVNIHYYAAASTLYGTEVHGGYEYEGKTYQLQNVHVPGYDTCTSCHDPHTLEINVEDCATCHIEVTSAEDLPFIRMPGSAVDFDGDGSNFEGISEEIETMQEMLLEAIYAYSAEVVGTPIVRGTSYPYWFIDTNANAEADDDEAVFGNAYNQFTGNLLAATYNYQVAYADPGGYAHNAVYHIQLMYDSIEALNASLAEPIDLSQATRYEAGHFDVTAEAFRHWDEDGEVSASCTKCHTAEGLPFFMENGVNIAGEPSNSLSCSTCHDSLVDFTLYPLTEVTFPSGAVIRFGEEDEDVADNLCLNCHQGRESTVSVNRAINGAGVGDDEISDRLTFRNIHYFAAGATLFGGEAMGGYQYEGKEYVGRFLHDGEEMTMCTDCHEQHELVLNIEDCADCHENVESAEDAHLIRQEAEGMDGVDYDGDGDVTEPIAAEIETLETALYAAIQAYASETAGTAIIYTAHAHPYWYIDANANGVEDEGEINPDGRFVTWTPTLLRAAYNYQYVQKDPGVFVHNADYALQLLYDSLEAIGGAEAVASFTRP